MLPGASLWGYTWSWSIWRSVNHQCTCAFKVNPSLPSAPCSGDGWWLFESPQLRLLLLLLVKKICMSWNTNACQFPSKPAPIQFSIFLRPPQPLFYLPNVHIPPQGQRVFWRNSQMFALYFLLCPLIDKHKHLPHSWNIYFSTGHSDFERFVCRSCGRGRWV